MAPCSALGGLGRTREPPHGSRVCRYGGPVLEAREGAAADPPEAAEEGGKYRHVRTPHGPAAGRGSAPHLCSLHRWLSRGCQELRGCGPRRRRVPLMTPWRTWRQEVGAHCTGRGPGLTTSCPLTCFLLGPLHLPADDFLEPKEYAESGEAADLGRSRTGPGVGGRGPTAHGCPSSRSRGRAGDPELRGAGPKDCGRPGSQWAGVWVGGPQQKVAAQPLSSPRSSSSPPLRSSSRRQSWASASGSGRTPSSPCSRSR